MDIQTLIDEYAAWLRSEITFQQVGEYYEITAPYLDSANDYLQIYVRQEGDEILFSDDGMTIRNLEMNGFQFTPMRTKYLKRILMQYGVSEHRCELVAKAPRKDFAQKKHLFIQAMLRVDDMFALSKPKVASLFLDDVQDFFSEKGIYCAENVQFTGMSGFSHNYDFLFQRNRTQPERLCQAVNNPNKSSMGNILFAWNDTKPARRVDSQLIVILNDQNGIAKGIEDAFGRYDAKVVRWSERDKAENLSLLSAS